MRKLSLSISLIIFTFNLTAQKNNSTPNIIIGPQAGFAFSQSRTKDDFGQYKQQAVVRPTLGIFADIGNNHLISLRTGISYLMLGNKADYGVFIANAKLNYLSIPILAKYKAKNGEFAVFAGAQINFLTSAKYKTNRRNWFDIKSQSEKTDIMGVLGISIEPHNTPLNFALSGQLGFQRSYTEERGADLYNRALIFTIQYKLFKH